MMMKSVFWWRKPEYPEETTDLRKVTDETIHTYGLCPVRGQYSGVHVTMFSNLPNVNAIATAVIVGVTTCYDKFHMVPICGGDQAFVRMLEMY